MKVSAVLLVLASIGFYTAFGVNDKGECFFDDDCNPANFCDRSKLKCVSKTLDPGRRFDGFNDAMFYRAAMHIDKPCNHNADCPIILKCIAGKCDFSRRFY